MKILILLLCCVCAFAQYDQIGGSSGSVAGTASSPNHQSTALVGQPIVGEASGGAFGTRGGITSIFEETIVWLDVPEENSPLPTEFSFAQNYPNPFNPSTTFAFSLPKASLATLVVYDQLGRAAAHVFERDLAAGSFAVQFEAPREWASGIYFAVFSTPEFQQVRKMILLK